MKTRKGFLRCTLQGTNISPTKGSWEDIFRFPQVGYVSPLEGKSSTTRLIENVVRPSEAFRSESKKCTKNGGFLIFTVRKKQTISRLSGHVVVLYVIFFSFQEGLFSSIFRKGEKIQRGDPITTDFPLNHLTEVSQWRARIFAGSTWPKWKGKFCSYEYFFALFKIGEKIGS